MSGRQATGPPTPGHRRVCAFRPRAQMQVTLSACVGSRRKRNAKATATVCAHSHSCVPTACPRKASNQASPRHSAQRLSSTPLLAGDNWVPVADLTNEYVSVGDNLASRLCKTHTVIAGGVPGWATYTTAPTYRSPTHLPCCDTSSPTTPAPTVKTCVCTNGVAGTGCSSHGATSLPAGPRSRLCRAHCLLLVAGGSHCSSCNPGYFHHDGACICQLIHDGERCWVTCPPADAICPLPRSMC